MAEKIRPLSTGVSGIAGGTGNGIAAEYKIDSSRVDLPRTGILSHLSLDLPELTTGRRIAFTTVSFVLSQEWWRGQFQYERFGYEFPYIEFYSKHPEVLAIQAIGGAVIVALTCKISNYVFSRTTQPL